MTTEEKQPITKERLRTPRVAGYAGILFSLLLACSMLLIQFSIPLSTPYQADWLTDHESQLQIAVVLVPFAGIAFLWFMGVIRDRLGDREDQFFSTLFLGSGLLFLGGLFTWVAVLAALLSTADADVDWSTSGSFVFGMSLIRVLGGVVTLRMAGVFMFASATIWRGTSAMPKWIVWLTYALSVVLLLGGASIRSLRLVFPAWVFIVSIMIIDVAGDRLADEAT